VVPKGSPAQILASSIVHAPFWKDVQLLKLTINMRLLARASEMTSAQRFQAELFAQWLLAIGEGKHDTIPIAELPFSMQSH